MARIPDLRVGWVDLRSRLSSLLIEESEEDAANHSSDGSAEEEVLFILRQRGGRVRQQTIVGELRWSPSKVSRLLTEMEETGQIERAETGREKVVALPGRLPRPANAE